MKRALQWAFFLVAFLVFSYVANGAGVSTKCADSLCQVSAAASMLTIGGGLAIFTVAWLLPRPGLVSTGRRAGVFRKLGSVVVDLLLVLIGFSALLAPPILLVEAHHVGQFHWQFARSTLRPTDLPLTSLAVIAAFSIVAVLRVRASIQSRPSFGQYLMGYQVIAVEKPLATIAAVKRIVLASCCLLAAPAYLLYKKIAGLQDDFWDVKARTCSVLFDYQ